MSEDNRKRPCLYRFLPEVNGLIRAYATKHKLTPNEAGETLINKTAAEIVEAARQIKRLSDAAIDMNGERNDYEAAAKQCAAEAESAREATRRADAEVERLTADLVTASEDLEAERRRDEAAHDALRAEIEATRRANRVLADKLDAQDAAANRLTRELASFRGGLDLATETIARVLHERDAALSELAEVRAALETKGADRLAERVETIASEVYAGFPDDFEAKIAARAPGWKGTLPELRARVITLGFSRYDALATDAAKRAAERGR